MDAWVGGRGEGGGGRRGVFVDEGGGAEAQERGYALGVVGVVVG